jgi:predicted NBD/HSP70 family sugar kinase
MTNASAVERPASPSNEPETPHGDLVEAAPRGAGQRRYLAGAAGVHIGGATCRAAAGFREDQIARLPLPAGLAAICDTIVAAIKQVEDRPRFVVVGSPGHVDCNAGEVSGAANLGPEWAGTVPLGPLLAERLGCDVEVRNDAEVALEAEKRRGALVAVNDGALITLSNGVGVALLVNGRDQPTELGHSVLQFDGRECPGRPHRGCFESYLGGIVLPQRYRELHPEFAGAAREIPDDAEFWADYGARLGELVVQLCLLGQPMEVISLTGPIAHAREQRLLPAVRARVDVEAALLGTVPRRVVVTPLGDDIAVTGALLVARDLLYPFRDDS